MGGGFEKKLPALLDSCGDADVIIITETHLPGDAAVPDAVADAGYTFWPLSRTGAARSSGGVAVLVSKRCRARHWRPTAQGADPPSPYHLWLCIEGPAFCRPLLLAASYLPPYRSKYGLRSANQLEDYFSQLGDETAEAAAAHGGADVLVAGDNNAHTGTEQEGGDLTAILQAALAEDADELLAPCSQLDAALDPPPPRSSCCQLPICP